MMKYRIKEVEDGYEVQISDMFSGWSSITRCCYDGERIVTYGPFGFFQFHYPYYKWEKIRFSSKEAARAYIDYLIWDREGETRCDHSKYEYYPEGEE